MNKTMLFFLLLTGLIFSSCKEKGRLIPGETLSSTRIEYVMPEEGAPHEGTWLQWPHHHQYGKAYRDGLDPTWIEMTRELQKSEKVHIIAYDQKEKDRISNLLQGAGVSLQGLDFKLFKTDDTWIRDNGPVFVRDKNGELLIEDWGFNAWGRKRDYLTGFPIHYAYCNAIPQKIGRDQNRELIDLNASMILEGGSVEIDGRGTLMACKSSILNRNRNPGMSMEEAEILFKKFLGCSHFIWLDGQAGLEITDQHIDGFARFADAHTIVTMNEADLLEYEVKPSDIDRLFSAKDKDGVAYQFLKLPLTQKNVRTTNGTDLGYKGSYVNYYIANARVLVPNYEDSNDSLANAILQSFYPDRTVVGIDVRNLYANGGMIHCVTQQQPLE